LWSARVSKSRNEKENPIHAREEIMSGVGGPYTRVWAREKVVSVAIA
jgi:hypothetical protein